MNILLRFMGRSVVVCVILAVALLLVVQYYRAFRSSLDLSRKLAVTQREIANLHALRSRQLTEIRRLEDPHGAIPEIHDRLRLVGKNEELIYVQAPPSPQPSPP